MQVKIKNGFDSIRDLAKYEKTLLRLNIRSTKKPAKKIAEVRKIMPKPKTLYDRDVMRDISNEKIPLTKEILDTCILEDLEQTLWQLSIRISEYNAQTPEYNYVLMRHINSEVPHGFFIFSSEYKSAASLIIWKPKEEKN